MCVCVCVKVCSSISLSNFFFQLPLIFRGHFWYKKKTEETMDHVRGDMSTTISQL